MKITDYAVDLRFICLEPILFSFSVWRFFLHRKPYRAELRKITSFKIALKHFVTAIITFPVLLHSLQFEATQTNKIMLGRM